MNDRDYDYLLDRVIAIELALRELVLELEESDAMSPGVYERRLMRGAWEILEKSAPHQGNPRRDLSTIAEALEQLLDDVARNRRS